MLFTLGGAELNFFNWLYVIDLKLSIIYTADVTSTALSGSLVFTQTDINKFSQLAVIFAVAAA